MRAGSAFIYILEVRVTSLVQKTCEYTSEGTGTRLSLEGRILRRSRPTCIFESSLWPQFEGWIEGMEVGDPGEVITVTQPRNHEEVNRCPGAGNGEEKAMVKAVQRQSLQ